MTTGPSWLPIDRTWASFRSRLGLRARFGRILTGVMPVVVLEKHWPTDQLDVYGANAITQGATSGQLHAVSLHNTQSDLELLVWRVQEMRRDSAGVPDRRAGPCHLFTPLQGYNPTLTPATLPFQFAWLQTPVQEGDAARLPTAHLDAGSNGVLQVVNVNGNPTTTIGPSNGDQPDFPLLTVSKSLYQYVTMFETTGSMPPLRVKPLQRLTVQFQANSPASSDFLDVNFWWSERRFYQGT